MEVFMFIVDKNAAEYIKLKSGSVVIELELQPAAGGWACSGDHVTGSYVPKISIGEPLADERLKYMIVQVEEIKIYYPSRLKVKEGFTAIRIILKKILLAKWLELEGAMGIVSEH